MILKNTDNKDSSVAQLTTLLEQVPTSQKVKVEQALRVLRAGIKGEQESAYLIDFDFAKSKNMVVIHDLRLEANGRVAQIDHLIINRLLDVLVLETKHFNTGMKITEEGEFLRWNDYKKCYEGMASPLAQNERHIEVLKDAFSKIEMPKRLGVRLAPRFHSYILVAPNARIDRPKKFDTCNIIKADVLNQTWNRDQDDTSVIDALGALAKLVSSETLVELGRQLVALHKPIHIDYAGKFGATEATAPSPVMPVAEVAQPTEQNQREVTAGPVCRACGSSGLSIQYGKYGYYFKCLACEGNTPIKLGAGSRATRNACARTGENFFGNAPSARRASCSTRTPLDNWSVIRRDKHSAIRRF